MGVKAIYNKLFCPYKTSKNREIYERVAEEHNLSTHRIYKIAHGSRIRSREESAALNDLILRGIVHSKWFVNR